MPGQYDEALKSSQSFQDPQNQQSVTLLQAMIRYEQDEMQHAKTLLRQAD